jgi:hypothetical protein
MVIPYVIDRGRTSHGQYKGKKIHGGRRGEVWGFIGETPEEDKEENRFRNGAIPSTAHGTMMPVGFGIN